MKKMTEWLEHTANWFGRKTISGIFHTSLLEHNLKEQETVRK
ncbi:MULTISPECIES: hypothetical protein [Bacillaceae]|uniref:Uncharacterized protein n=1 Tax=Metabacillus sediminis TaxID=3117746 RepID=A0ABZ2NIX3_9BACI|nr:hypothetical protein [Bacillus sp. SJS]